MSILSLIDFCFVVSDEFTIADLTLLYSRKCRDTSNDPDLMRDTSNKPTLEKVFSFAKTNYNRLKLS